MGGQGGGRCKEGYLRIGSRRGGREGGRFKEGMASVGGWVGHGRRLHSRMSHLLQPKPRRTRTLLWSQHPLTVTHTRSKRTQQTPPKEPPANKTPPHRHPQHSTAQHTPCVRLKPQPGALHDTAAVAACRLQQQLPQPLLWFHQAQAGVGST